MDKKPLVNLEKDMLEGLDHLGKVCGDDFIIVGAAARDILLQQHNIRPVRATRDADLGVRIGSWDAFKKLRGHLISVGFKETKVPHRFHYKAAIFDIMPFGDILTGKSEILWPEDGKIMNMLGFDDAFHTAHQFRTSTNLTLRIASLSSLVLLKVIAWNDRPTERPQDPQDINTIIKNYLDAGHFDRFYDEHSDLSEMDPYTVERAGAALIGRDLQRLCSHNPLEKIKQILERELQLADGSRYFQQMAGAENLALAMDLVRVMLSNMK